MSDEFVGELEEQIRMLNSTVVSVLPLIDKFGHCFVNSQTFIEYNSADKVSVIKSMFALKESNDIHLLGRFNSIRKYILHCNAISMGLIKL